MKKKITLKTKCLGIAMMTMLMIGWNTAIAQNVVFYETCGTTAPTAGTRPAPADYTGWDNEGLVSFSGDVDIRATNTLSSHVWFAAAADHEFIISGINTSGKTDLMLSFKVACNSASGNASKMTLTVKDAAASGSEIPITIEDTPTGATNNYVDIKNLTGIPATTDLEIRFAFTAANNPTNYGYRLDDILITSGEVSDNNNLATLTVSEGTLTPEFDPAVTLYSVELPTGTTTVPEVQYTLEDPAAQATPIAATGIPGTTSIKVVAENGAEKTYSINFTAAPPSGLWIETFEDAAFAGSSYTKRTVTDDLGQWIVSGVGTMDANDRYNGSRGIRFRGGNAADTGDNLNRVEMNFDKTGGIGTVSFKYGSYSTHAGGILNVEYSTDQGVTWVPAGSTDPAPSWVNGGSALLEASFPVNIAGDARIRVTKTFVGSGSISVDIDDLSITDFAGTVSTAATPTFTPAAGSFIDPISVTISTATEGASVYYTTDGSAPTASSTLYTDPFTVSTTTTVKAIAIKEGMSDSPVASITYTFPVEAEVADIAEFINLTPETVAKITGTVTVVYQNGSNLFVQDASGWVLIYGSTTKTYQNGDLLTNVIGKLTMYSSATSAEYPEVALIAGIALPDGIAGDPVEPKLVDPADLTNADLNRYIAFENVEIADDVTYALTQTNGTIVNGDGTMVIADWYKLISATFVKGDKVDVTGLVRSFNGIQIYLLSIEKSLTGINNPNPDMANVFAENGVIYVKNLQGTAKISVFDIAGRLITQTNATEIPVNAKGVYVVKVNAQAFKVVNK